MVLATQAKDDGTLAVDTNGTGSSEYASMQSANLVNIIGTICGTVIAIVPQVIAMTPGNTKVTTIAGIVLAVATNVNSLLVKLNYANGRVAVKQALIQAGVDTAKAQSPQATAPAQTNVLSGGTIINATATEPVKDKAP